MDWRAIIVFFIALLAIGLAEAVFIAIFFFSKRKPDSKINVKKIINETATLVLFIDVAIMFWLYFFSDCFRALGADLRIFINQLIVYIMTSVFVLIINLLFGWLFLTDIMESDEEYKKFASTLVVTLIIVEGGMIFIDSKDVIFLMGSLAIIYLLFKKWLPFKKN